VNVVMNESPREQHLAILMISCCQQMHSIILISIVDIVMSRRKWTGSGGMFLGYEAVTLVPGVSIMLLHLTDLPYMLVHINHPGGC
jgi:hypothetical protein